jgi:hypothetical protein
MIGMAILQPVVALAAWTMVMWAWMYWTRIPAMNAAKVNPEDLSTMARARFDELMPPSVNWKAANYNHLHEAPTVFYAIALLLAIVGQGDGLNATLGWIYVGLRVVHSLVQAIVNRVMVRFAVFMASSVVLIALILHAAIAVF